MPDFFQQKALMDRERNAADERAVRTLVGRLPEGELLIQVLGLDGVEIKVAKGRYQP